MHDPALNAAYDMGAKEERKMILAYLESLAHHHTGNYGDYDCAWDENLKKIIDEINNLPCQFPHVAKQK
jgi:hypothetical protein